jgi:hypothetical protein
MPSPRLLRWALPALALGLAACGSHHDKRFDLTTPKPPPATAITQQPVTHAEAAVIRGWADTLRNGRIARAARYFALPSQVANGTALLPISTFAQAKAFNRALPCGAKVVALERSSDGYVIATFRLTERPGPGSCGTGTGASAFVAFRTRHGHIVQWIRVPDSATPPSTVT